MIVTTAVQFNTPSFELSIYRKNERIFVHTISLKLCMILFLIFFIIQVILQDQVYEEPGRRILKMDQDVKILSENEIRKMGLFTTISKV